MAFPDQVTCPFKILTPEQVKEIEILGAVLTLEQISDYFGVGRNTFTKMRERQPEIEEHYQRGKAKAIKNVAENLIQKAIRGDMKAATFYLRTRAGWKETQALEHTSPDGSMTPTKVERVIIDERTTDKNS